MVSSSDIPVSNAFIKVSEDLQVLFSLETDKCAEPISSYRLTLRVRQVGRIEIHNSATKIASALNYIYEDKIVYERAIVNRKEASFEKH